MIRAAGRPSPRARGRSRRMAHIGPSPSSISGGLASEIEFFLKVGSANKFTFAIYLIDITL